MFSYLTFSIDCGKLFVWPGASNITEQNIGNPLGSYVDLGILGDKKIDTISGISDYFVIKTGDDQLYSLKIDHEGKSIDCRLFRGLPKDSEITRFSAGLSHSAIICGIYNFFSNFSHV